MSEARTSLNIVIIHLGKAHDTREVIETLERLDAQGNIGLGEVGVVKRTNLGWLAPVSVEGRSLESLADALEIPEGVDPDEAAAALTFIGQQIPPDSQAVLAIVAEPERMTLIDREMEKLGGSVHRRAAIDVFTDLEEAIDQQEQRRTFRARAEKKLDKLVKNKIRKDIGPIERLERTLSKPFERFAERMDDSNG